LGILAVIPILKPGSLYFGSDDASQQSLKEMIEAVSDKYHLKGKDFYIGGFSIGGTCVVKYAELAVKENYRIKPNAVFAVDPPLDWARFFNAAKRVVRLSEPGKVNGAKAILVTTAGKGYREPGHIRHPHSWSIADPAEVLKWLLSHGKMR
jgi:hypothetical protein